MTRLSARTDGHGQPRPDDGRRATRQTSRLLAIVAVAAAATGLLAGCGGSNGPSLSTTTPAADANQSALPAAQQSASAAVKAQAKADLAKVHAAEAKLAANYTWLSGTVGKSTSLSAKDVLLFVPQRTSINGAHGTMVNAAHAARNAAQASPRDCATVAAQRSRAYDAYNRASSAYNDFVTDANAALAGLAKAPDDRAAVQSAYQELVSFAKAHPEAGINLRTESTLALAHSPADDAVLLAAVKSAQSSLAATNTDLQKVRGNVANIAPSCG